MAYYLFNFSTGDAVKGLALREQAGELLRLKMWGIDADERDRDVLAPGDLVLIYLAAPEREFIGRAELASAVRDWTPSEAQRYPGDSRSGVFLSQVEEWDPPLPMETVLAQIDPAADAKADFQMGVVRITAHEYETALAVGAGRLPSTGSSGAGGSRSIHPRGKGIYPPSSPPLPRMRVRTRKQPNRG